MRSAVIILSGILLMTAGCPQTIAAQQLSATDIIKKADDKFNGEKSSYSVMSMTVVRPAWQRTFTFRNWTLGKDYALTLITDPPREAGQTFLKRGNEMWNWNPSIGRLIKLPPSLMSQGWMGSDYTNDNILKESSIVTDYIHEIKGEENIGGRVCYVISMKARENASVIWGRQKRWIDKKDFLMLKAEEYDEDGTLVRTETGSEIREMDGRSIPTRIELVQADTPANKTLLEIREIRFNLPLETGFFSQQNMKRVR